MIRVIYIIFAIIIKDIKVYLDNLNLLLKKSVIWFKLLIKKKEIGKQKTNVLYYKY